MSLFGRSNRQNRRPGSAQAKAGGSAKRFVFSGVVHPERALMEMRDPISLDLGPEVFGQGSRLSVGLFSHAWRKGLKQAGVHL